MERFLRLYPIVALFLLITKVLISGMPSISEAIIILGIIGLICLQEFKLIEKIKKEILNSVDEKLKAFTYYDEKIRILSEKTQELDEMKSHLASLKMAQSVQSTKKIDDILKNARF